jgi:voltage-gated potassium channel
MWLLIISIGMIGLTVGIHTLGAAFWLRGLGKRIELRASMNKVPRLFEGILSTAIVLITLHIFEAFLWAILYLQLPAQAGLKNFHDAVYFSMITFTTLGYGDITLTREWQILSGIEGMVGITVFGLTTALLFAVIQKIWRVKHKHPQKAD